MVPTSRIERADEDAILPIAIGTVVWAVLLVILAIKQDALTENGTSWWLNVAIIGVISGTGGMVFLIWRRRRLDRRASGVTEV